MTTHYLEAELDALIQSDPEIWQFLREGSLDGVWYWDLENPEHEYMSPEFWRLFGFDPAKKEHLVAEWQDLIFPEDLEIAKRNVALHIADPAHPYDQVVRYRCADGQVAWVRCRGLAIRNAEGRATRLLGAHNDLTQQMRDRQAAEETSSLLSLILDTTRSGIIGLDEAGRIVSINSAGRHMLGGLTEGVPCDWPEAIRFIDPDRLQPLGGAESPIPRALAGEVLSHEILLLARTEGREARYVRVSTARVEAEVASVHTVVILDDVSEQERTRQQVERTSRLDALGQLTGGIAHDFNNLLATVQYALQLADAATDEAQRREYIQTARASVDRGSDLTKRLLAFARQQPGLASSEQVASVLDEFRKLAVPLIESSIRVDFVVSERDLWVYCDTAQLGNALLNLLLNARDAILRSGEGDRITVLVRGIDEIEADVTLRREHPNSYIAQGLIDEHGAAQSVNADAAYRYVEFAVTDNGPGMTDEVKRRAVDPFFTTKDNNAGSGLGLSIVYGFIQQSDGELRLYSEPGQGTTVRMLLPRGTAVGGREAPQDKAAPVTGKGERILLVEDELALMGMTRDLIRSLGYDVETARTGRDALEMIEHGTPYDLVITDIVMPGGVDGFKLAKAVRDARPGQAILYMSGYTGYSEDDIGDVAAPMLQKPCPPNELAAAIRKALQG
ncbi:MAG: ATP-binding protein [Pseudomonadota bacterium]